MLKDFRQFVISVVYGRTQHLADGTAGIVRRNGPRRPQIVVFLFYLRHSLRDIKTTEIEMLELNEKEVLIYLRGRWNWNIHAGRAAENEMGKGGLPITGLHGLEDVDSVFGRFADRSTTRIAAEGSEHGQILRIDHLHLD